MLVSPLHSKSIYQTTMQQCPCLTVLKYEAHVYMHEKNGKCVVSVITPTHTKFAPFKIISYIKKIKVITNYSSDCGGVNCWHIEDDAIMHWTCQQS